MPTSTEPMLLDRQIARVGCCIAVGPRTVVADSHLLVEVGEVRLLVVGVVGHRLVEEVGLVDPVRRVRE